MNFLEKIFQGLQQDPERVILQEAWENRVERTDCHGLLQRVARARGFLRSQGLAKGERCVLLANNSIRWAAMDLAIMAEGVLKVPMYARQAPAELVTMMQDCAASLVICGDDGVRREILALWPEAPPVHVLAEVFDADNTTDNTAGNTAGNGASSRAPATDEPPVALRDDDPVTIIYTSGTSGDSKGVVLSVANLDHMLPCTMGRLDELMRELDGQERVFHYLPFCFAGSWILLLTSLTRRSLLTLATDLEKLADQLGVAAPHYYLNVPILLDRIREGVDAKLRKSGGPVFALYRAARGAWQRKQSGSSRPLDALWLSLARALIFAKVKRKISPNLVSLICGSAPLAVETQLFFEMMGIPVLQVYGLTETTAICTMDRPQGPREPGRVGVAVPGIEMKVGDKNEILVRGPNVFLGYWERPDETAACMRDGWFQTGDQGEVDANGNWRIIGRVKNLIVLSSGHNVAPDAIEESLLGKLPDAQQVVVIGHERKHLTAIVTGAVEPAQVKAALDAVNAGLPHYKRVRAFHIHPEAFTIENGFLTANGKLKRQLVLERFEPQIEALYVGN